MVGVTKRGKSLNTISIAIGEQALLPETFTPHIRVADLSTNIGIKASSRHLIHSPKLSLTHVCIVVVIVLITLLNSLCVTVLTVVSHIILISLYIVTKVALCKLINIEPIVTTKQVLNLAIVLRAINASTKTCS